MTYTTSEKALTETFLINQSAFFKSLRLSGETKMEQQQEVNIGYGVTDILYYQLDRSLLEQRKKMKVDKIDDRAILEMLVKIRSRDSITSKTLDNITKHLSSYSQDKTISYLIENKFLCYNKKNNCYDVAKKYIPRFDRLIAIELKLKNWSRALFQAQRYNLVSDYSFVALPTDFIKPALRNLDDFKNLNVGLIEIFSDNVRIVHKPKRNSVKYRSDVMIAYTLENLIAKN
ncbi:MAG: hypothetical protein WCX61_00885 [Candidatus Peribacteraceae bacterium]|jgi:hypothetical protein